MSQRRGLARPIGPQQGHNLALLDIKGDAVKSLDDPVTNDSVGDLQHQALVSSVEVPEVGVDDRGIRPYLLGVPRRSSNRS